MAEINAAGVANPANDATKIKDNNEPNAATPKKRRRGLGEVRGTTRLKFDERDIDAATGLFKAHLESVELAWATQKEDSSLVSFSGLAVPYLVFTFASNAKDPSVRKYVTLRISPAESNALTIPGGDEAWKVEQPMNWLKHILNVFVLKGNAMSEEMMDALELPFEDFNDNMEYVPVEPEVVLNGWRTLFENFLGYMENNGKPVYKSATGNYLPLWIKLIRFTKIKGQWKPVASGNSAGDFAFPSFVGTGYIELFDQNRAPVLHVDASKESIIYREVAKAPTAPQIPGMAPAFNPQVPVGAPAAAAAPMGMGAVPQASVNPTDDLPF